MPELPGEVRTTLIEVDTPVGLARVHLSGTGEPLLVLGHGAGGGIEATDLQAAKTAALQAGWRVALVEQPWRVAGRKVAAPPAKLDLAWLEVMATQEGRPLVVGGRSAGARVACRTATQTGADAVLCLAFPLHPPGRPDRSRLPELVLPTVPVLVVQGSRDRFGVPPGATQIVGGDHSLRSAGPEIITIVESWLQTLT